MRRNFIGLWATVLLVGVVSGFAQSESESSQTSGPPVRSVTVSGQVRDTLFGAVAAAGEDPELAVRLTDIFAWDLDFYTDLRRGDTFRLLVEKEAYPNGESSGYGRILAAEYDNDGRIYQAVLFRDASGMAAYYSPDGKPLQKQFLRSPLKFAAPIGPSAGETVKGRAVNFAASHAAPVETLVQAVGEGRVIFAGRKQGEANTVVIEHANGYQTTYSHLSAILVRDGQHVEAGGRIGLVTGASSAAPHVDFRIVQHGEPRNLEALRFDLPPAEPVADGALAEFSAVRDLALAQLKETSLESRSGEPAADSPSATPLDGSR